MEVYPDMPWLRDLVETATILRDARRQICYEILKGLAHLIDMCGNAVNKIMTINIMDISPVKRFANSMSPVASAALVIAICAAGLYFIFRGGKNKELFRNLLFSVILIAAIPFMFTQLNNFKNAGISDINASMSGSATIGTKILQSDIIDVAESTSKSNQKAKIDSSVNPYYLDINARLPESTLLSPNMWEYKITSVSGNDKTGYKLYGEKLGNGFFGMGKERLYAYSFSFWIPFFTMLITIVAMLFAGLKVARTIFDLAFHQVIAPIVFASDVNNGARSKKFLQSLFGSFIMVILVLALIKIFLDISSWLNGCSYSALVKILMLAGSAWGVIDGPDIVIKLLGIDAGVRSATSVLLGASAAYGAVKGAGHTVGSAVQGAVSGARSVAGKAAAFTNVNEKMKRGEAAFTADKKAVEKGETPENDSFTDYAHNLNKNTGNAGGFHGGYDRFSNIASMAGYAKAKVQSRVSGVSPFRGSPSVLKEIQGATQGKPLESAANAAALSQGKSPEPEHPSGVSAVAPNQNAGSGVKESLSKLAEVESGGNAPGIPYADADSDDTDTVSIQNDDSQRVFQPAEAEKHEPEIKPAHEPQGGIWPSKQTYEPVANGRKWEKHGPYSEKRL